VSVNPPETTRELDGRSREFLDFERDWWKHAGSKERAVRERFGMTAARYHQLLYRAVDEPADAGQTAAPPQGESPSSACRAAPRHRAVAVVREAGGERTR
jgi:hypothetical protein